MDLADMRNLGVRDLRDMRPRPKRQRRRVESSWRASCVRWRTDFDDHF
jgi:hypothetical protein